MRKHLRSFAQVKKISKISSSRGVLTPNSPPCVRPWNCKLITAQHQDSEPGSCALWVSYRQIMQELNQFNWN